MKNTKMVLAILVIALFAVGSLFVIAKSEKRSSDDRDDDEDRQWEKIWKKSKRNKDCMANGVPVEIAEAKLFFEVNDADEDTGIHGAFDTGSFAKLCVYDPNGKKILAVNPEEELRELGMSGIFFESREPGYSEISIEEHMENFPEGEYTVRGVTHDGVGLIRAALFSHDIPEAPTILFPEEGDVVSTDDLIVEWEPVTQTMDGEDVNIVGYQVIVTKETDPHPHARFLPVFDVYVAASQTTLSISPEFLEPGSEYELEILALEESGNQVISIVFFETEE